MLPSFNCYVTVFKHAFVGLYRKPDKPMANKIMHSFTNHESHAIILHFMLML